MQAHHSHPATKTELVRMKKEIAISKEGLELLERKRDILMAEGLQLLKTAKQLRSQVTQRWALIDKNWQQAVEHQSPVSLKKLAEALPAMAPLEGGYRGWMSVKLANFSCKAPKLNFLGAVSELDLHTEQVRGALAKLLPELIELMNTETNIRRIAVALKQSHRQVNALTQVVIPELEYEKVHIEQRLEEKEREAIFQVKLLKARML